MQKLKGQCPNAPSMNLRGASLTETPCAGLTVVTLADEDTNSILTDNANRAFQRNVAKQVTQAGGKMCN